MRVRVSNVSRRQRNDTSHIAKRDGSRHAIIKQDCVEWNRVIAGGVQGERDTHNFGCQKNICRRVNALDLRSRRILLFKRWIIVMQEQAEKTTVIFQCGIH